MKNLILLLVVFNLDIFKSNAHPDRTKLRKWKPSAKWFQNMMQDESDDGIVVPRNHQKHHSSMTNEEISQLPISFDTVVPDDYNYDYEEVRPNAGAGENKVARQATARSKFLSRFGHMEFQTICPSRRRRVLLNTDPDYEYRPDSYEEVFCAHPLGSNFKTHERNKVCSRGGEGFSCIQLTSTIFLSRRLRNSECWEIESRVIPSSCDCMWAKHVRGDISDFH